MPSFGETYKLGMQIRSPPPLPTIFLMDGQLAKKRGGKKEQIRPMIWFLHFSAARVATRSIGLMEEMKGQSDRHTDWIARSSVNSRDNGRSRYNPRFQVVLGLGVLLVRQIVNVKSKIYPAANLFGQRQIHDVES